MIASKSYYVHLKDPALFAWQREHTLTAINEHDGITTCIVTFPAPFERSLVEYCESQMGDNVIGWQSFAL